MPLEIFFPMSLTKAHLIKAIAIDTGFSQKKTSEILALLLKVLTAALANGDSISLRGFGKFYLADQKARKIKLPLTGKIINVGPKRAVKFKSFKFLREAINDFGSVFDVFKRQNKIILQQLYDLIKNSGDYEEEEEEETLIISQKNNASLLRSFTFYIYNYYKFSKYRYLR